MVVFNISILCVLDFLGMLFHILGVLYENTNFLSYVEDRNDWIKSKSLDNMPDTVVFCLLLNAQRFPEV
jgi:hypothetical protein